jgi:uncharacterized delta-60 repeat protein
MKRPFFLGVAVMLMIASVACNQSNSAQTLPQQAMGSVELTFDLNGKTAQANFTPNRLSPQAILSPQTAVSFASAGTFNVITDGTNKLLNATFNVSNTSGGTLTDVTLVAYRRTGNRANTAISNLQNFGGLSSGALDNYALAAKPTNGMTNATTVNAAIADLQLFTEAEITSLTTDAGGLLTGGDYLFPYGYVARAAGSSTSRSIANGSNTGALTVGLKVPDSNEPGSSIYRFSMTFLVFTTPVATRVAESLEEQASSGALIRGNASGLNTNQVVAVAGSSIAQTEDKLVNACRVRTAGTAASPSAAFLVTTAPSTATASFDQCFASAGLRRFSLNAAAESIRGMVIQPDGKIILVGSTTSATTASDFLVVRLNPDGSFDRSFGTGGKIAFDVSGDNTNDQAAAVLLQADGKIVVGGSVGTLGVTAEDFAVIRVNTDGTRDTTFGAAPSYRFVVDGGSNRNDQLGGLALQTVSSVSYIVVAGITNNATSANNGALFRLKVSDGTLDTTFGTSGFTLFSFAGSASTPLSGVDADSIRGVAVDTNQKIVVVGDEVNAAATSYRYGVIRFTSGGTWEMKAVTTLLGGAASGLILNSTGTQAIVCAYSRQTAAGTNDFLAMRFNLPTTATDGALDTTFGTGGLVYLAPSVNADTVRACTTDSSGRIILVGAGRSTGTGTTANDAVVARVTASGAADTTFGTNGILTIQRENGRPDEFLTVKTNSSGKIIVGGYQRISTTPSTDDDMFVVQLNP